MAFMDSVLIVACGWRKPYTHRAAIDHDGHCILLSQIIDQQPESRLQQRQLIRHVHGAGYIDQEDQLAGGSCRDLFFSHYLQEQ